MRILLENHTDFSTRALRRAVTLGHQHARSHSDRVRDAPDPLKIRMYPARAGKRQIRYQRGSGGTHFTLPAKITEQHLASSVAWALVQEFEPNVNQASLDRLFHEHIENAAHEPIPKRPRRKKQVATVEDKYKRCATAVREHEARLKELARQKKRTETLLKKREVELRRYARVLEQELDSTEGLSDKQLAARLRVLRNAREA